MLVVSDSSPLIARVQIEQIEVLPRLFKQVVIPPAVKRELESPRRQQTIRELIAAPPQWLSIQQPTNVDPISDLHPGETEAIRLALEIHAEFLLVDERRAYQEAISLRLNAIGTIRVLERAAEEGLLNLQIVFDRIKQTDFWISHELLDERLRLFLGRKNS